MITLYGVTEDGTTVPVQVTEDGKLVVHQDGSFEPGDDIEAGNITATGSITAAGDLVLGEPDGSSGSSVKLYGAIGSIAAYYQTTGTNNAIVEGFSDVGSTKNQVFKVSTDGLITTLGNVQVGEGPQVSLGSNGAILNTGRIFAATELSEDGSTPGLSVGANNGALIYTNGNIVTRGDALFANRKCGFTSEGDLVFTSRGDRFRIVVQQGICYADPYPVSLELKEKLDRREPKTDTTDIVRPDQ